MSTVGQVEELVQKRVIELFQERLGYTYLGDFKKRANNKNIEVEYLTQFLKQQGNTRDLINGAINKLTDIEANQQSELYDINKEIYTLLRYGVKVRPELGKDTETVYLIDWDNPHNNDFYVAEEVTIIDKQTKRPDIVIYVNGIALGVIELKRSTVSVQEAIYQNLDNQSDRFIQRFFNTMQLVMAGTDSQGLRYGTIKTSEKYYLKWKEDETSEDLVSKKVIDLQRFVTSQLDKDLISICHKERFINMLHDFIVFDQGIKKLARPNQFFGVKAAIQRVKARQGGILWHTQGSGKSLIMVWLTKWIRENIPESRVLIITDREELDDQIEKVFYGVEEQIYRTTSGVDLIDKLNHAQPSLIGSLVHKFGRMSKKSSDDYDLFIKEIKENLPNDFSAKGDIYVFVDEAHRTQSGKLHEAMKTIIPHAMFIGFTGTPLLKQDKQTSIDIFGSYIHTYKFDEAVEDEVVLDLQYEARHIEQEIYSEGKIDDWFEMKTSGLSDIAKGKLKERWGTMKKVTSSNSRLTRIADEIIFDMERRDRLRNKTGNAMLVANTILEACLYYEIFQQKGFKECAIITSYEPNINDIKGETTGSGDTEAIKKFEVYEKMLNGQSTEDFDRETKEKFINEPGRMRLLIVVDKLLTGFDAPSATYLYIDKKMKDHGLFQAICRVNRLDGEDKKYGYIIDFMDLFNSLEQSIHDYTTGALDAYEKKDVEGLLKDYLKVAKINLDNALDQVKAFCEPITSPRDSNKYFTFFMPENPDNRKEVEEMDLKRKQFYQYVKALTRAYGAIANEMEEAGYTSSEMNNIRTDVSHYEKVRLEVMHHASDSIDLKSYEADMRHLIDAYIGAKESRTISAFEDMTLIDLIVARGREAIDELPEGIKKDKESVAETIENGMRKVIIEKISSNPKYYEKMSHLLDELIRRRKEEALDYEAYLKEAFEMAKNTNASEGSADYPHNVNSAGKQALFDNLKQDESLALTLHNEIMNNKLHGWRGNRMKERVIRNSIYKYVTDEAKVAEIFNIIYEQSGEY